MKILNKFFSSSFSKRRKRKIILFSSAQKLGLLGLSRIIWPKLIRAKFSFVSGDLEVGKHPLWVAKYCLEGSRKSCPAEENCYNLANFDIHKIFFYMITDESPELSMFNNASIS